MLFRDRSIVWIYHAFFSDLCSQSFPVSNNAVVNNMLHKSRHIFARMSLGCNPRREIVEIKVNTFVMLWIIARFPSVGLCSCVVWSAVCEGLVFTLLLHTCFVLYLFYSKCGWTSFQIFHMYKALFVFLFKWTIHSNFGSLFCWIMLVFFSSNFRLFYYILGLLALSLWNKYFFPQFVICLDALCLVFIFSRHTFFHSQITDLLLPFFGHLEEGFHHSGYSIFTLVYINFLFGIISDLEKCYKDISNNFFFLNHWRVSCQPDVYHPQILHCLLSTSKDVPSVATIQSLKSGNKRWYITFI